MEAQFLPIIEKIDLAFEEIRQFFGKQKPNKNSHSVLINKPFLDDWGLLVTHGYACVEMVYLAYRDIAKNMVVVSDLQAMIERGKEYFRMFDLYLEIEGEYGDELPITFGRGKGHFVKEKVLKGNLLANIRMDLLFAKKVANNCIEKGHSHVRRTSGGFEEIVP